MHGWLLRVQSGVSHSDVVRVCVREQNDLYVGSTKLTALSGVFHACCCGGGLAWLAGAAYLLRVVVAARRRVTRLSSYGQVVRLGFNVAVCRSGGGGVG
jgi:hypothetical protein